MEALLNKNFTYPLQLDKCIIKQSARRQKEARPRTQVMEKEKLLLDSNLAMIAFGSLFHEELVLLHHFGVGEGDAVDALK
jgi:hypothetical protein